MATRKPTADVEPVSKLTTEITEAGLEISYSRSWELAVVKYEKMSLFTAIKTTVPADADTDLTAVGEKLSDRMNELQGTDLNWARAMTNNKGSLITRIVPE